MCPNIRHLHIIILNKKNKTELAHLNHLAISLLLTSMVPFFSRSESRLFAFKNPLKYKKLSVYRIAERPTTAQGMPNTWKKINCSCRIILFNLKNISSWHLKIEALPFGSNNLKIQGVVCPFKCTHKFKRNRSTLINFTQSSLKFRRRKAIFR